MNSSVDLTASGQVALNVFGFVLAKSGFVLAKSELSGDDGPTTLSNAPMLSLVLSNASLFIGVGGRFHPTTGAAEAGPGGVGLEATVTSLTLAPSRAAARNTPASRSPTSAAASRASTACWRR